MRTFIWMGFSCCFAIVSGIIVGKLYPPPSYQALSVQNAKADLQITTPVCLDRSDIPEEELHWLHIPSDPAELATHEDYGYLSGQLIQTGVVDASDCPFNGLWPTGYANACGLERTREISVYLQNVYDDEILTAGNDIGVPPVMIKQLIRYESQFWPVRMGLSHFGLGHLTYLGAANALLWSRDLFENVFLVAPEPNVNLPGHLLSIMDATCPTCPLGIDVPKAERSIAYLAQGLMGYCRQTTQVVLNATGTAPGNVVDYATIWKLTLLNYNAGPMCVYHYVNTNFDDEEQLSWDTVVTNVDTAESAYCRLAVRYVENITAEYYEFQTNP